MHSPGHLGLGFLASTPLSLVALSLAGPGVALAVSLTVVGLSTLPDVDERLPGVEHRTWTHSFAFAVAVGASVGLAWWGWVDAVGGTDAVRLGLLGGTAGTVAVLSHLLGDAITPMGIAPFWPVSRRRRSLNLVRSKNVPANYLLLSVGVLTWGAAVVGPPAVGIAVLR